MSKPFPLFVPNGHYWAGMDHVMLFSYCFPCFFSILNRWRNEDFTFSVFMVKPWPVGNLPGHRGISFGGFLCGIIVPQNCCLRCYGELGKCCEDEDGWNDDKTYTVLTWRKLSFYKVCLTVYVATYLKLAMTIALVELPRTKNRADALIWMTRQICIDGLLVTLRYCGL